LRQPAQVSGDIRSVASTRGVRDLGRLVRVITYPTRQSGEQEIVAPPLQPRDKLPQGCALDGIGEGDRIETRIAQSLDEAQAIALRRRDPERGKRTASCGCERGLRVRSALLFQPAQDRIRRRERQSELQAAASHGREQALGLRGDKEKNRGRRGFLEVRSDREEVGELTYLLDADLLAALLRGFRALLAGFGRHALGHDQPEVGVIALRKPVARVAGATRLPVRSRRFAQQGLSARLSKFEFAQALPALYQDRMGQPFAQLSPSLPRLSLPLKYHVLTYS